MMYLKVHLTENGNILAMCDFTLIDRILVEGDVEINIKDYCDFYMDQLVDKVAAEKAIRTEEISSANIIGEESIKVALDKKIIVRENVKEVMKIPYAYAFRVG